MREPPFIAGAGGGVGTSTLAAALRGRDCGVYRAGKPVHVLACRSTMYSLGCAQRALRHTPTPPVLAVVDDVPHGSPATNTTNRLRMTEGHVTAIIRVPFVAEWRDVESPQREAREVLLLGTELPKTLRAYEQAVRELVEEILLLDQKVEPSPLQPDDLPATADAAR